MKKLISFFIGIMMALSSCLVTSCSNDDDSLAGVYGFVKSENSGSCYNFINDNTVVYYPNATLSYTAGSYIGKSWWSSHADGEIYTYFIEDNKVYIPMQGTKGVILTLSDKVLIKDGTSDAYKKDQRPK